MILEVAMATEVAIKIFTIIFLVLSDNDHSVKVLSNCEMGPGQLFWSSQRIGVNSHHRTNFQSELLLRIEVHSFVYFTINTAAARKHAQDFVAS